MAHQVNAAAVEWNPTAERLRELTKKMPNSSVTEFGNVAVMARVDSRSTRLTYLVEDSTNATKQRSLVRHSDRIAAAQDAYIAGRHVVVVDGESKKGGLRMWNKRRVQSRRPGAARGLQHAGCKVIPVDGNPTTVLIVGLSGTGKTTTTFTTQLDSKPAQDDFVALMPGGRGYATENGCFAKTFGLDPQFESAICYATTKPDAYLENVLVGADGTVDFFGTSYTKNGHITWPFSYVDPWPADQVPRAEFLLILNRDENIASSVARLDRAQAAAYFMLGETTGTSAGGKDEEASACASPGPTRRCRDHQPRRLYERQGASTSTTGWPPG